jgi:hypothetical protein
MKPIYFAWLMLFSSIPTMGRFGEKLPIKWGKIARAEFSIAPSEADSAASAIVLCDFGNIEISNRTFYTRHTRIKILKPEGLRYAVIEIPYQTKNRHDDFLDLRARTLVMQNGKITSYRVPAHQIEDIKINDTWSKKKFTFPNVEPGAIIEFRYTVASLDFEKLNTWYFQREIPTVWSELRFQVPDPFVYLVTYLNSRPLAPDEEMMYGQKLQWLYETRSRPRRLALIRDNYVLFATHENRYKVWALNNMKKKIVMRNLPGLSSVPDDRPVTDFYPMLRFDLFESSGNLPRSFRPLVLTTHKDYETRGEWSLMHDRMAIPGYVHYRLKTWSEFNSGLLEHERFGMFLMKSSGSNRFIDSISDMSKPERLEAVLRYVHNNYHWNGAFTLYTSQDFKNFMINHNGSTADINLLMVNLLRQAGITADPLLIRTSDRGLPEKMFPVKGQFNHVIVLAMIDGVQVLLDAAVGGSTDLNRLHKLDIGTQAWIVREENPGWIEIFSPVNEAEEEAPVFKL